MHLDRYRPALKSNSPSDVVQETSLTEHCGGASNCARVIVRPRLIQSLESGYL